MSRVFTPGMISMENSTWRIIKHVQNQPQRYRYNIPMAYLGALWSAGQNWWIRDDIRALSVNGTENVMDILSRAGIDIILDQYDYIVLRCCTNGWWVGMPEC
jgi:hypothetical protein